MKSKKEKKPAFKYKWSSIAAIVFVVFLLCILLAHLLNSNDKSTDDAKSNLWPISQNISYELLSSNIGLTTLDNCRGVLDYYKENALKEVSPWGLTDTDPSIGTPFLNESNESGLSRKTDESLDGSTGRFNYSSTNIQVGGVDEADVVKTDGDYLYIIAQPESPIAGKLLKIVKTRGSNLTDQVDIVAEVSLNFYAEEMLLSLKPKNKVGQPKTLIIVGRHFPDEISVFSDQTRLVQINVTNPKSPKMMADLTIDGRYTGIRLVNNEVRLIVASQPLGFNWANPHGRGLMAEDEALEKNQDMIKGSKLSNWTPSYRNNLTKGSKSNQLIDCPHILIPNKFSGLETLSVMTFNASHDLNKKNWKVIGLAADGEEIYANQDNIYVAVSKYRDISSPEIGQKNDAKTVIHKFGTDRSESSGGRPIYMASGEVAGTILNQFSMDEYQGDLRVAVTVNSLNREKQENHVRILRPKEGSLEEIGAITGLGIDESIFAVRFMGPQAYLVTFRQIDPLYSLDLSDPTNPKNLGELKITGFSSYLHPVGNNLLLGIGQEADERGISEGLQISLFDTSQPSKPKRIDQILLKNALNLEGVVSYSQSPAEDDHRAFLFYQDLSYIPYATVWNPTSQGKSGFFDLRPTDVHVKSEAGVLAIKTVDRSLFVEKILTANYAETDLDHHLTPVRTVVVNGLVYGITFEGEIAIWEASTGKLLETVEMNRQ